MDSITQPFSAKRRPRITALSERPDDLLKEQEVALLLEVSRRTVQGWRYHKRNGPIYSRIGGAVRYRRADVDAWLAARRVVPKR